MVKKSKIVIFFLVVAIIFGAVFGTAKMVMQNINLGLDLQGDSKFYMKFHQLMAKELYPNKH